MRIYFCKIGIVRANFNKITVKITIEQQGIRISINVVDSNKPQLVESCMNGNAIVIHVDMKVLVCCALISC